MLERDFLNFQSMVLSEEIHGESDCLYREMIKMQFQFFWKAFWKGTREICPTLLKKGCNIFFERCFDGRVKQHIMVQSSILFLSESKSSTLPLQSPTLWSKNCYSSIISSSTKMKYLYQL